MSLAKAAVDTANEATLPWSITLETAVVISAILWTLLILIVLLLFRERIPALISSLTSRIARLASAGVNIEQAGAQAFTNSTWHQNDASNSRSSNKHYDSHLTWIIQQEKRLFNELYRKP